MLWLGCAGAVAAVKAGGQHPAFSLYGVMCRVRGTRGEFCSREVVAVPMGGMAGVRDALG